VLQDFFMIHGGILPSENMLHSICAIARRCLSARATAAIVLCPATKSNKNRAAAEAIFTENDQKNTLYLSVQIDYNFIVCAKLNCSMYSSDKITVRSAYK